MGATGVVLPIDRELAAQAVEIASNFRLRGSDAVYATEALRFNADLVTRDREQCERVAALPTAVSPEDVLSRPINETVGRVGTASGK